MELSSIDEGIDQRRLAGLRALDASLRMLAEDERFQRHLQCPIVKLALKCWVGGRLEHLSREELQQIQVECLVLHQYPPSHLPFHNSTYTQPHISLLSHILFSPFHTPLTPPPSRNLLSHLFYQTNQAVLEVYPSLKALDDLCAKIEIRFPIDHIAASKHELCQVTTHPINIPYQQYTTRSIHPLTYPINTPHQHTLSTHPLCLFDWYTPLST